LDREVSSGVSTGYARRVTAADATSLGTRVSRGK